VTVVVPGIIGLVGAVAGGVLVVLALRRAGLLGGGTARHARADEVVAAQQRAEVRHGLDRVADLLMGLQERQAEQHGEVSAHLTDAARATAGLADTTHQLRRVLASTKARGQWGERMADDVLRLAGFTEGISYVKQTALPGGTVPDVTFLLPGDLRLNMDVKFPVDNYLRALDAPSAVERASAEKAFLRDVRARVRELAGRGYVVPGVTVDHVLLFIPNEAVYGFVHERDPALADLALQQKVVLCSPFTLFAVLGVIRQAVEAVQLTRASDEILATLADFGEQWERFAECLDAVGRKFDTAHRGLDELTGTRRRQLERRLDRIDDLRARRGLDAPGPPGAADAGPGPRPVPVDRAG
jgi:DNA recombination protein RmuC